MSGASPTVAFVMEQHLGHQTFADNLRAAFPPELDLELHWVPVTYRADGRTTIDRFLPTSIASAWIGRSQVRAGIRSIHPDGVVYNTQVPAALGGRLARSRPYVVITDVTPAQYDRMADGYGHRADRVGPLRDWKHRTNRRVFRDAAACVGWSSWVCESLRSDYGVSPEALRVIPPGVDTEVWRTPERRDHGGPFTILFVGGDFERKGGHTLLAAFEHLPTDSRLVLVSRSAPDRLGPASDRIEVIDDLQPNDPRLVALYASSDVFALPSHAETFGIAAVEASASGMPVVATRVGAFSDIVDDGVTGLLVDPADPLALARALCELAGDPQLRGKFGRAARERVLEHFDAGANARRLLEVVRDALR